MSHLSAWRCASCDCSMCSSKDSPGRILLVGVVAPPATAEESGLKLGRFKFPLYVQAGMRRPGGRRNPIRRRKHNKN